MRLPHFEYGNILNSLEISTEKIFMMTFLKVINTQCEIDNLSVHRRNKLVRSLFCILKWFHNMGLTLHSESYFEIWKSRTSKNTDQLSSSIFNSIQFNSIHYIQFIIRIINKIWDEKTVFEKIPHSGTEYFWRNNSIERFTLVCAITIQQAYHWFRVGYL